VIDWEDKDGRNKYYGNEARECKMVPYTFVWGALTGLLMSAHVATAIELDIDDPGMSSPRLVSLAYVEGFALRCSLLNCAGFSGNPK
jgi:hypothetical protein